MATVRRVVVSQSIARRGVCRDVAVVVRRLLDVISDGEVRLLDCCVQQGTSVDDLVGLVGELRVVAAVVAEPVAIGPVEAIVLKRLELEEAVRQRDARAVTIYDSAEVKRHVYQRILARIYYERI